MVKLKKQLEGCVLLQQLAWLQPDGKHNRPSLSQSLVVSLNNGKKKKECVCVCLTGSDEIFHTNRQAAAHHTTPPLKLTCTGQNGDETICRSQNSSTKLTILPPRERLSKVHHIIPRAGEVGISIEYIYTRMTAVCTTPQKLPFPESNQYGYG
jgi:hypothetical protein